MASPLNIDIQISIHFLKFYIISLNNTPFLFKLINIHVSNFKLAIISYHFKVSLVSIYSFTSVLILN